MRGMKPFGIRLPDKVKKYYEEEAKSMGVSAGDRMRRILEQHMDAERRANAGN